MPKGRKGAPLYQRGGVWWCRVLDRTGRILRKSTRCKDYSAACIEWKNIEREAVDQDYAAAKAATLEECIGDYFADLERRRVSPSTMRISEQKCGHFARLWKRDLPMSRIDATLVHQFVDTRQAEGVSDLTIKMELGRLGQVLTIARHHGKFHVEPARVMPPYFSGHHKPRTRAPTLAEVEKLLRAFEEAPHRQAHLAFIVATGARFGEAFRAEAIDVDFVHRKVRIRGTKTELSAGDVPITPLTEGLLRFALERRHPGSPMFRPWGKMHRDIAAACVRAGIEKCGPNDLRRAFGTWHREAGLSAELVSKLLRHATDKLAQTTYANIGADAVGRLVEAQLAAVPTLYLSAAETAETGPELLDENSAKAAEKLVPPAGVEPAANALGKPSHSARSIGTRLGLHRAKAATGIPSEPPSVPIVYTVGASEEGKRCSTTKLAGIVGRDRELTLDHDGLVISGQDVERDLAPWPPGYRQHQRVIWPAAPQAVSNLEQMRVYGEVRR